MPDLELQETMRLALRDAATKTTRQLILVVADDVYDELTHVEPGSRLARLANAKVRFDGWPLQRAIEGWDSLEPRGWRVCEHYGMAQLARSVPPAAWALRQVYDEMLHTGNGAGQVAVFKIAGRLGLDLP